jgi:hypothetical protein
VHASMVRLLVKSVQVVGYLALTPVYCVRPEGRYNAYKCKYGGYNAN